MTYQETLDFLYTQLPMYQRDGSKAFKKDLTNTLALCEAVGNPQHQFKSIHIAGTNGKGSVSHMLAAVCQANDLKTGLYTSPHLVAFTERIKIDGMEMIENEVIEFVQLIQPHLKTIKPSFFEITVVMAFYHFAQQKVDLAIIETGLGGRLDSTNVITPLLSIITSIGLDHTDMLGDTITKIATEKAGIIKPQIPVVIGHVNDDAKDVFYQKAKECRTGLFDVDLATYPIFESWLKGNYQTENIKTVSLAIRIMVEMGILPNQPEKMQEGMMNVSSLTGLRGRWQILSEKPKVILDVGHNIDGVTYLMDQLKNENKGTLHLVWGMVNDKNHEEILALLPKNAQFYFSEMSVPRGLPVSKLAEIAAASGLNGSEHINPYQAYLQAAENAKEDDTIFIGGSTFVVADFLRLYGEAKDLN